MHAPKKYATYEQEVLAIVIAIYKWYGCIDGKSIVVFTSYALLVALLLQPNLSSHQINWIQFLGAYKLAFEYHLGVAAVVPDFLATSIVLWLSPAGCSLLHMPNTLTPPSWT